jgi:hypothetical protein
MAERDEYNAEQLEVTRFYKIRYWNSDVRILPGLFQEEQFKYYEMH